MKRHPLATLTWGLASAVLLGFTAQAQTFTYQPTDLLLGFRNGGAYDYVVDLGQVNSWNVYGGQSVLQPNTTYNITAYSGSQLSSVFGSLDNISFSAFADVRTTSNPKFPIQTIWTTAPRMDINTQSDPWNRRSQFQQANTAAKIEGIANGAVTYSGLVAADPVANSPTAVEVPSTWNANGTAYTIGIGSAGNFANTFPGVVENTTPVGFASGGTPIVSDLYEMAPSSSGGAGDYLGYFTLGTDGNMTFTTVPEPGCLGLFGGGLVLLTVRNSFRRKY